jgi:hypothetical protein
MVADYSALYSDATEQSDMVERATAKPAMPSV